MVAKGEILAEKYCLERFLGSGGFASVWAARNIDIDRPVALKILSENLARVPHVVTRFVREATIAARQIHETILRVEDIGKTRDDIPFLVMELLEGQTLSQEIKQRGAIPIMECVEICHLVLEGLATAHARGIIHRDIKPSNIFITSPTMVGPRVRILDLGLAKDLASGTGVTGSGQWMGTPDYLPPELFLADQWRELGPSGDVFAVGVSLFEMLTGRRPLDGLVPRGRSPSMLFKRIAYYESHTELPRALDVVTGVPPELDSVLRRALAVEPTRRYADAGEMLDALDRALMSVQQASPGLDTIKTAVVRSSAPPPFDTDQEMLTPTSRSSPRNVSYLVRKDRDESTADLVSSDLLAVDASFTPTALRHGAKAAARSDISYSSPSGAGLLQRGDGTIDVATADLIEVPRRPPSPPTIPNAGPPADATRDLGPSGGAPAWSALPAATDLTAPPAPAPSREPSKNRGLVLGLALGAMGVSLVLLTVVIVLTRYDGGDGVPETPTTASPIVDDPNQLLPEKGAIVPAGEVSTSSSPSADAGHEAAAPASADGGVQDEATSVKVADHPLPHPAKRHPLTRHPIKRPHRGHKVHHASEETGFDTAIPFDELGQQGVKSANGTRDQ